MRRSSGTELHRRVRERIGDGGQGPSHHHRVERFHAVQRHGADDHARLLGLRQWGHALVAHDEPDVCNDGQPLQLRLGRPLRRDVLGCGGQQLCHHLCRGVGDGHSRPSDNHRLEHLHDVRRTEADDHTRLLRLRQRRLVLIADDEADVHDGRHKLECGLGQPVRVVVQRGGGLELHIAYVNGSVTLNTAPLTITPQASTMTYGGTVPTITPGYSGFVNGDSAPSLTTTPTCSTTATSSDPPSPPTYASACSGASDPNYTIVYDPGATTVTPAPIPVAVSGSQANEGVPNFVGTVTQPLPSGVTVDTTGVTCGQVLPSTNINGALASGSYTLLAGSCSGATLSGANDSDYTPSYTSATDDFTVTGGPATQTTPPPPSTPPPVAPPPPSYGYWLVGSDGGIFTFGSAQFYGSTGSIRLQRPVVGISPTADKGGYWLVASDGGIFAFGDAGYSGSIPGDGLSPAGSGLPHSLNAPIVAMVPSSNGGGYFMVASDGGVFAFGDARFAGSCPGMGGCSGAAVSVVPDASGNGYWLVTQTGNVYAFGDARFYGAPGNQGSPVTSAARTADGGGYWVLLADGAVYAYGDAVPRGGPVGSVGGFDPASTIFSDADGGGYWVASADGAVFPYGNAPNDGSMAGSHLNGSIIAATGF